MRNTCQIARGRCLHKVINSLIEERERLRLEAHMRLDAKWRQSIRRRAQMSAQEPPYVSFPVLKAAVKKVAPILGQGNRGADSPVCIERPTVNITNTDELFPVRAHQIALASYRVLNAVWNNDDRQLRSVALGKRYLDFEGLICIAGNDL